MPIQYDGPKINIAIDGYLTSGVAVQYVYVCLIDSAIYVCFHNRLCWRWCYALSILSQSREWPPSHRTRDLYFSPHRQL